MQITALCINFCSKEGLFFKSSSFTTELENSSKSKSLFNSILSPKDAIKESQLVHLMWTINLSLKSESFSALWQWTSFLFPRTLSHLYQSADWSHEDLSRPISEVRRHMTKCKLSCFSLESLQYYAKELKLRKQEGYQISSIDFWGLLLEKALDDGVVFFLCFL